MYKKFSLIIILFLLLFSCVNKEDKVFVLETDQPESKMFQITNNGNYTAEFSMVLNDLDLSSDYKIVQYIKYMPEQYPGEPMELKALRFVHDYTWHDNQLTDMTWLNSPNIMINSIGGGLCGLRSAILTNILIELGFRARSWCIEGHVISEVYSDGKWKVLDPDYGIYFLNDDREIASYKELCDNPEWFDDVDKYVLISKENDSFFKAYIFKNAKFYSSYEDNRPYYTRFEVVATNSCNAIEMPPGSKFSWPYKNYKSETSYTLAKLTIKPDWCGTISLPFVIAEVKGEGEIIIGGEIIKCKENLTSSNIFHKENYVSEIEITSNTNGMELYFFINPKVYSIGYCNTLEITGNNVSNLDVNFAIRDSSLFFDEPPYSKMLLKYIYRSFEIYTSENDLEMFESREIVNDYICDTYSYFYTQDSVEIFHIKEGLVDKISSDTVFDGMTLDEIADFVDYMYSSITYYLYEIYDVK